MKFSFELNKEVSAALQKVKSDIQNAGGKFNGDIKAGNFEGQGIKGNYNIISFLLESDDFTGFNIAANDIMHSYFCFRRNEAGIYELLYEIPRGIQELIVYGSKDYGDIPLIKYKVLE
ncbi:hypothetical protein AGMMS50268_26170 [Spirochaetia bacterium]|nr:hypothetical protein AGMMS50268_26170 [Spirochaetia bacterium]